jgi:hypothetical protein
MEPSDPFFDQMFARMSPGAEYLFSPYQLDEIKKAFGARSFGGHAVDFRTSVRLFRSSYYLVFLAGRERRLRSRLGLRIVPLSPFLAILALAAFLIATSW